MLLQILCQTLRPCPGTGKQGNLVAFFLILFQILHQKLKAAVISTLCTVRLYFSGAKFTPRLLAPMPTTTLHEVYSALSEPWKIHKPLNRKVLFSFFFTMCAAGGILFLHAQSVFQNTVGFIQKQKHFFLGKIIHKKIPSFCRHSTPQPDKWQSHPDFQESAGSLRQSFG